MTRFRFWHIWDGNLIPSIANLQGLIYFLVSRCDMKSDILRRHYQKRVAPAISDEEGKRA